MGNTYTTAAIVMATIAVLWMVTGIGAATAPVDEQAENAVVIDAGETTNATQSEGTDGSDGQDDGHRNRIAEVATGHDGDVRETITFGDRDAHNVEINTTVRENQDDEASETLPGVTNVAAGTNLTVATSHGDDVSDEATRAAGEGRNPQTG